MSEGNKAPQTSRKNTQTTKLTPAKFLKLLRESDPRFMANLFHFGGCFHLFRILQAIWPDAVCWYAQDPGHVYTEINGRFYDIDGCHGTKLPPEARCVIRLEGKGQSEARDWLLNRFREHGQGVPCLHHPEALERWNA